MYRDIDSMSLQDHRLFIRGPPKQVRLYNGSSDDFVGFGKYCKNLALLGNVKWLLHISELLQAANTTSNDPFQISLCCILFLYAIYSTYATSKRSVEAA